MISTISLGDEGNYLTNIENLSSDILNTFRAEIIENQSRRFKLCVCVVQAVSILNSVKRCLSFLFLHAISYRINVRVLVKELLFAFVSVYVFVSGCPSVHAYVCVCVFVCVFGGE